MRASLSVAIHAVLHGIAIFVNNFLCGSHRRMALGADHVFVFFMAKNDIGSDAVDTNPPNVGWNGHSVVATGATLQLREVLATGSVTRRTVDVLCHVLGVRETERLPDSRRPPRIVNSTRNRSNHKN